MRRRIITFLSIAALLSTAISKRTNASVLTVSNALGNVAQYLQINPAIAAASSGDTIYVAGSTITYLDATINKPLTLIGPGGFNQTSLGLTAKIANISLTSNASNTSIFGMVIFGGSISGSSLTITNLTISNCHFPSSRLLLNSLLNSSGITIRNNVFSGGNSSIEMGSTTNCFNLLIEHNIINGFINGLTLVNAIIQNNFFYNSIVNGYAFAFFNGCSNLIIKNNTFFNADPIAQTIACIYTNNITYSTSSTYTALGGSNLDNVNPLFVNVPVSGNYTSLYNLHLQTGSPAIGAGSDGNDIGYYGGIVQVNPSGELFNMPFIRSMEVLNTDVLQNGNVNVKVRSTKAR
ncbi:MAG: hypothetical protein IPP32_02110 [Bacteroidetes bacterium]|nr:hypothetical protein [Bacteroidota bacterium]